MYSSRAGRKHQNAMEKLCWKENATHYVKEKRSGYAVRAPKVFLRPVADEILSLKPRLNRSTCARLFHAVSREIAKNQQYNADYLRNEDVHANFLWLQTK